VKIITSASQKGGSGKSFLCLHSAGVLAEMGKRVLLCDVDQQGNLSGVFIENLYQLKYTIDDLLIDEPRAKTIEVIQPTEIENIHILPANIKLSNLDVRLAGDYDAQTCLAEALRQVQQQYDYILIDCPPSLSLATRMALVAADGVIVPLECHEWAFIGAEQILSIIKQVKKRANPKLKVLGLVINKYKTNRIVEREYERGLRQKFPKLLFTTMFRDHVQFVEAVTAKKPITHFLPKSEQAAAFRSFVKELLGHG